MSPPSDTSSSVRKSVDFDAKVEAFLMYKHILCQSFLAPAALPMHQFEPFDISVEFVRLSTTWTELELLDKDYKVVDTNIPVALPTTLASTAGQSITPPGSPTVSRSNSSMTMSPSSKASMLLGLTEAEMGGGSGTQTISKKSSLLMSPSATLSPKFGLLARSASNNLLRPEASGASPIGSSPLAIGSSSPSSSSPLGQSASLSNLSSPLSQSPNLSSSPSFASSSPLHYKFTCTIQTKDTNYSFNAREKEHSALLVDGIKLLAVGRPHFDASQTTLDSIADALDLAHRCRPPPIPPLPSSPPPPPPHLKV
eukprot:gene6567-7614_t